MLSKKIWFNIVIRVVLITGFSFLIGFLYFRGEYLRFSLICSLAVIVTVLDLMFYLNRTNRNIKLFFDSVKNDDSSLSFTVSDKKGTIRELYQSMNNVNLQIQNLKIEASRQDQFFQKILGLVATGIITYDEKGFIHHANQAARKLLSVDTLTHIKQIEQVDRKLFNIISKLKPDERHLITLNTDRGEIQLLLKSVLSGTKNDVITILSVQNIKNELDEKETDAWMKLIRVLMHEIMNSVTPITSLSESLLKIYRSGNKELKPEDITADRIYTTVLGLDAIREQGGGLINLVDSYRRLSSIQKPVFKIFSVSRFFSRMNVLYDSFEKENNARIEFRVDVPDLQVYADENMISQVLVNLIKNAIEANESNPRCLITITAGLNTENQPEICVCDNGPGITAENIERIFVPFFTTREGGSGIGLSISRQIMELHGGSLTVRSVPAKETTLCLRFRKNPVETEQ